MRSELEKGRGWSQALKNLDIWNLDRGETGWKGDEEAVVKRLEEIPETMLSWKKEKVGPPRGQKIDAAEKSNIVRLKSV